MPQGPIFTGQLGVIEAPGSLTLGSSQLGRIAIGGPGPFTFPPTAQIVTKTVAHSYIATLFDHNQQFKKSLGQLLNRPKLKWTINAGHHPVELDLPLNDSSLNGPLQSDLVRLYENGGDGKCLYTGTVSDIQLNLDDNPPYVALMVDPLVTELGDAPFDRDYQIPTDIAQMVRDAVAQTAHIGFNPQTIPNSGIYGTAQFRATSALEVVNTAKSIGGPYCWWFVDELGLMWFQVANAQGVPFYTFAQGQQYTVRKKTSPITDLKNYVTVVGGIPPGGNGPLISIMFDQNSINKYGRRVYTPSPVYPGIKYAQAILDAVASHIITTLSVPRTKVQLTLPNWGSRIRINVVGGATARIWEPSIKLLQPYMAYTPGYSANLFVLDVELDGPSQVVILGDLPVTADDIKHEIERHLSKLSVLLATNPMLMTNQFVTMTQGGLIGS